MHCPYCGSQESEVVETRDSEDMDAIRRRRACHKCQRRFTTYERIETVNLHVIKKDGRREQFNREKLKAGLIRACEKTTVSLDTIERIATEIIHELRGEDTAEIQSERIGQLVADHLKKTNKIAYIRFSSVFRRFVDVEDFEKEVKKLIN
jgi:transcriptional repressor NrdR